MIKKPTTKSDSRKALGRYYVTAFYLALPSLLSYHQEGCSYQKQKNETKQKPSVFREGMKKGTEIEEVEKLMLLN